MFRQLLAKSPARLAGERLKDHATTQSRLPGLYEAMGVPDTIDGRFELLTLHVILLIDRLKGEAGSAEEVRQHLFDAYLRDLDGALREMGVGDLSVGKRMRRLGEAFYGRARAYDAAFAALPDPAPLQSALTRMVMGGNAVASAGQLAAYVRRCRDLLAQADTQSILQGEAPWPKE